MKMRINWPKPVLFLSLSLFVLAAASHAAAPTGLERATMVSNAEIFDRQNHSVGRIQDLVLDFASGKVLCAVAVPNQVYGDIQVLVPAKSFLGVNEGKAYFTGDVPLATSAPSVTRSNLDSAALAKRVADAYAYFHQEPVWQGATPSPGLVRFSALKGMKIHNRAQDDLGSIIDLMVNLPTARIVFAVASMDRLNSNLYAVPPTALGINPQSSSLMLGIDKAALVNSTRSGDFIFAQMSDPASAAALYRRYGLEPDFGAEVMTAPQIPVPKNAGGSDQVKITGPNPADTETTRNILAALLREGLSAALADNQMKITTVNGRVTLAGRAADEALKQRLQAVAETVAGRGNVDNQLQIGAAQ